MKLRGCTGKDIAEAMTWARGACHAALGPVDGERLARTLPASVVLLAWALLCRRAAVA